MPHFYCHRLVCASGRCLKFHFYPSIFIYHLMCFLVLSFGWSLGKPKTLPTWNFNLFLHNFCRCVCELGKCLLNTRRNLSVLLLNVFVLNWGSNRRWGAMVWSPRFRVPSPCPLGCECGMGCDCGMTVTPIMHNFDGRPGTKTASQQ